MSLQNIDPNLELTLKLPVWVVNLIGAAISASEVPAKVAFPAIQIIDAQALPQIRAAREAAKAAPDGGAPSAAVGAAPKPASGSPVPPTARTRRRA